MEIIEHVDDVNLFLKSSSELLKKTDYVYCNIK